MPEDERQASEQEYTRDAAPSDERQPRRQPALRWSGYEHQHEEKGSDWFWALGIIATSAALISILFGNILFALLIVVAAMTLGMLATKPPEMAEFAIDNRGLSVNDTLYPYSVIEAFWVEEREERTTLLVNTQKMMAPHLVIPVEDVDPEDVRERLEQFVPEVELHEPFAHRIMEWLGF